MNTNALLIFDGGFMIGVIFGAVGANLLWWRWLRKALKP